MVRRLLTVDPAQRMAWDELNRHPWVVAGGCAQQPARATHARSRPTRRLCAHGATHVALCMYPASFRALPCRAHVVLFAH